MLSSMPAQADAFEELLLDDKYIGILINQNNVHWVAMCKHAGLLYYVDRCYAPRAVGASQFHDILELYPMSFAVERNCSTR